MARAAVVEVSRPADAETVHALVVGACRIASRSVSELPTYPLTTRDMSNSFAFTAFIMASSPGRLSRPLAH